MKSDKQGSSQMLANEVLHIKISAQNVNVTQTIYVYGLFGVWFGHFLSPLTINEAALHAESVVVRKDSLDLQSYCSHISNMEVKTLENIVAIP